MTDDPNLPSAADLDAAAAEKEAAAATSAPTQLGTAGTEPPHQVTSVAPAVVADPPDTRTDGERHADLLREVSDHSAPPVGAEQVMHKPEA